MSASYPKVHVVGSGAYYSYRPITRMIEKVDRNHIRECSSRPKEFAQYVAASNSRGDGYSRAPSSAARDYLRGSSLPPFESSEKSSAFDKDDDSFFKRGDDDSKRRAGDSIFKRGNDDSFFKRGNDDSLLKRGGGEDSLFKRGGDNDSLSRRRIDDSSSSKAETTYFKPGAEEVTLNRTNDALFSTDDDVLTRLRRKHPYRLPVENEVTAPHESSIWPENRPHFDLVSSYDLMVDYLGIRDKSKQ